MRFMKDDAGWRRVATSVAPSTLTIGPGPYDIRESCWEAHCPALRPADALLKYYGLVDPALLRLGW